MSRSNRSWRGITILLSGLLIAVALAFLAGGALDAWYRHRLIEEGKETTAFKPGSFAGAGYLREYLNRLPALSSLQPDGLRFVAVPELESMAYAATLALADPDVARGILIIWRQPYQGTPSRRMFRCEMSKDAYVSLREQVFERLRSFGGDDGFDTDGTSIVIETASNGRVSSGEGNYIEPYRGLGEVFLARLREGCRGAPLPEIGADWYGCGNTFRGRCSIASPSRLVSARQDERE